MQDMWLLQEHVARELEALRRNCTPTAEQMEAFAKSAAMEGAPRNLRIAGNEAEIIVEGVLTKRRDLLMSFFSGGNCTYNDIRASLALAESDPSVKRVVLRIDSPGGQVAGLLETIHAIEAFSKPIVARASCACSAAYALAAACNRIEAQNEASEFGCLGVAVTMLLWDDEITLTNTDSPEKRPDPRTPEGKASIVKWLDATHEWFVAAIARGRARAGKAVTTEKVNADFGRGATLMAADAKARGMIDGYMRQPTVSRGARAESEKERLMQTWNGQLYRDLKPLQKHQLKAEQPELYRAMKDEADRDWVLGRAYESLPPLARAQLRKSDPELHDKLRDDAIARGKWKSPAA